MSSFNPANAVHHHLALALIPGMGPKLTAAVLAHFGSAQAVLQANANQFREVPLIGDKLANQFAEAVRTIDIAKELKLLENHGVRAIPIDDPEYPSRVRGIDSAPSLLYVKGTFAPQDANAVGIVGSRACTSYGKRMAESLASGLAWAGWTVVSGLARGIDGVAHKAALDAGGRTLAVLAGGLAKIYPPEHKDLAHAVSQNGAILSETPMMLEPQPGMFPARNRIISAFSRAVVIVEANIKSGALITATHALEQGREVYAVPGNVDSPASAGCLELIRKGARLVRTVDDILEDLQGVHPPDGPKEVAKPAPDLFAKVVPPPGLDEIMLKVWEALTEPVHADVLARTLGLSAQELSPLLMKMELKKAVRRLPGNTFERR